MKNEMFKCVVCNKTFTKEMTEKERVEELNKNFKGHKVEDCELVCDDCYEAIMRDRGVIEQLEYAEEHEMMCPECGGIATNIAPNGAGEVGGCNWCCTCGWNLSGEIAKEITLEQVKKAKEEFRNLLEHLKESKGGVLLSKDDEWRNEPNTEVINETYKLKIKEFAKTSCSLDKVSKMNMRKLTNRMQLWSMQISKDIKIKEKYEKVMYLISIQRRAKRQKSKLKLENRISKILKN